MCVNLLVYNQFFDNSSKIIILKLNEISQNTSIKFNIYIDCVYDIAFKTSIKMYNKLLKKETEFLTKGSGWSLKSIDWLQLKINLVNPLAGSTYIKLPSNLECKRTLTNVKNTDSKCFKYAIFTKFNNCKNKFELNKKNIKFFRKK